MSKALFSRTLFILWITQLIISRYFATDALFLRLSKKVWKGSDLKHLWSGCQNSNLQYVLIRIRKTIWLQWILPFGTFCMRLKKPNDDKIGSTRRMTHCRCISGCKKCCSREWLYYFTPNEIRKNWLSIQCQHTEDAIISFLF